jgi:UDP-N-acetylmuramoylalanine--D-glutamate ligase
MTDSTRTPNPPELAGARVAVVGAGRSGLALSRFLLSRQASVLLTDTRGSEELGPDVAALGLQGVELQLGGHDISRLLDADLIAVSPGVPMSSPPLAEARRRGVRVVAEVEMASWFLKGILIGITGSNGKSTTTALTAHLLEHGGLSASACGNLGTPLSDLIEGDAPDHHYVVELSSFQLEGIESFRPRIAVLLNLSPDHQDRYPDSRAYYTAKSRIFMNQQGSDHAILNRDDPEVWRLSGSLRARVHPFSRVTRLTSGACVDGDRLVHMPEERSAERSMPLASLSLFGAHNTENALAALLVAGLCGVPMTRAVEAMRAFTGLPHRLERVAEIDGVTYFDDSKATNVGATAKSLESFPGDVVLILGGKDKGGAFADLRTAIRERVAHLVLMGAAREAIAAQIGPVVPTTLVVSMKEAVRAARGTASRGGVVLLAPACASFDQYGSFEERGDDFKRRVLELAGGGIRGGNPGPPIRTRHAAPVM